MAVANNTHHNKTDDELDVQISQDQIRYEAQLKRDYKKHIKESPKNFHLIGKDGIFLFEGFISNHQEYIEAWSDVDALIAECLLAVNFLTNACMDKLHENSKWGIKDIPARGNFGWMMGSIPYSRIIESKNDSQIFIEANFILEKLIFTLENFARHSKRSRSASAGAIHCMWDVLADAKMIFGYLTCFIGEGIVELRRKSDKYSVFIKEPNTERDDYIRRLKAEDLGRLTVEAIFKKADRSIIGDMKLGRFRNIK